ncbi:uncharacterized protein BO95DRAFT_459127 [Aspergillus brunneoviolaceus CBS 621.78]|uniref:Uncharacterized protein n=5 Tax=Aspergillus TaxID=5052 RepID=A0A8G1RU18_9EURO|nr:hypothetical protein BO95DRAFT_459127 [Aspergillus brunneoviolaceus CBS 621.78]XP_025533277.1 hypothetical protein BO86DRAFT_405430 [Aspergillus japonicus CBS 114.51]XP_040802879.1 uncharacterized protein BO72DRAFT_446640 [Aspergillus fijiensis CBS 313.89]PYI34538.1 hypothetical protein BP00DRAFT_423028 [Aspergillus indologenus CBS 114.80]RAH50646.1 hypothetical protein BO95DRAFT_459127 [Aspergillus brunneoviolaceus CBS 621.78]RAH87383.1 hypothetical protein BO86DRAFT_405430 [Aspergillus ja
MTIPFPMIGPESYGLYTRRAAPRNVAEDALAKELESTDVSRGQLGSRSSSAATMATTSTTSSSSSWRQKLSQKYKKFHFA